MFLIFLLFALSTDQIHLKLLDRTSLVNKGCLVSPLTSLAYVATVCLHVYIGPIIFLTSCFLSEDLLLKCHQPSFAGTYLATSITLYLIFSHTLLTSLLVSSTCVPNLLLISILYLHVPACLSQTFLVRCISPCLSHSFYSHTITKL